MPTKAKSLELERQAGKNMNKIQKQKATKNTVTVTNYPIGDFLIRLKNTALAGRKSFEISNTKLVASVAKSLKDLGYISEITKDGQVLKLSLVYKSKMPMLSDIILVSKPSKRVYMSHEEIQAVKSPYQMILTTTGGIMSSGEAVKKKLGGEVLAKIL